VGQPESRPTDRSEQVRADNEDTPRALLAEVYRSKSRTAQIARDTPRVRSRLERSRADQRVLRAREDTLEALENYSAALRLRGWPTPTKMGREIRLLRSLCGEPAVDVPREIPTP
jgi:hypothetical protein